jgi:hypothetical protein
MLHKHRDLGSTCEPVRTCSNRITPDKPIASCEEFAKQVPVCPRNVPQTDRERGNGSCTFAGLCVSCQLRWTCLFPKPEGGVWNCDEYC